MTPNPVPNPKILFPSVVFKSLSFLGYDYYLIGNDGSVWSRYTKSGGLCFNWRLMKTIIANNGYPTIGLCKNGKQKPFRLHILLLEAFIGPRPPNMLGLHKNDDKTDFNLNNLYWGSVSQNSKDAYKNGKRKKIWPGAASDNRGDKNGMAVLSSEDVIFIRNELHAQKSTVDELAKKYKQDPNYIMKIAKGSYWKSIPNPISSEEYEKLKRFNCGDKAYNAALTNEQASEIKKLRKQGYTQKELAYRFQTTLTVIKGVLSGRTYKTS